MWPHCLIFEILLKEKRQQRQFEYVHCTINISTSCYYLDDNHDASCVVVLYMKMKSEDESKQNLTSCFNPRLVPIHCGCPCQFRDGWWKELANKGCNERPDWAGLGQVQGANSIMSGGKCLSSPSAASAASAAVSICRNLQSSRYAAPVWRCHCGLRISSDHLQQWRTTTEDVTQSQVAMGRHDTWDWD